MHTKFGNSVIVDLKVMGSLVEAGGIRMVKYFVTIELP
jgi:hypothetical protein